MVGRRMGTGEEGGYGRDGRSVEGGGTGQARRECMVGRGRVWKGEGRSR